MAVGDFEQLSERILTFARSCIADEGFVIPLGAVVASDGQLMPIQRMETSPMPDSAQALVDELFGVFRQLVAQGRCRAVAWCVDMRVQMPGASDVTDAIVMFFESPDEAKALLLPYHGAPGPGTAFGAVHVQANPHQIFV
jgi:hypothetical protein